MVEVRVVVDQFGNLLVGLMGDQLFQLRPDRVEQLVDVGATAAGCRRLGRIRFQERHRGSAKFAKMHHDYDCREIIREHWPLAKISTDPRPK